MAIYQRPASHLAAPASSLLTEPMARVHVELSFSLSLSHSFSRSLFLSLSQASLPLPKIIEPFIPSHSLTPS